MNAYFGMYKGICTNNADPEGLFRIKAIVPTVFGDTDTETEWAWPCWPPGYSLFAAGFNVTFLPIPMRGIWISFEGGDIEHPIWMGEWQ